MEWIAAVHRGEWIATRLDGWGTVGGTVPRGFEAYARVFHPVPLDRVASRNPTIEIEGRLASWREITELFATTWHPLMQWRSISRHLDEQYDVGDRWRLNSPQVGRLELSTFASLAHVLAHWTSSPNVVAGVWSGWGDLHPSNNSVLYAAGNMNETQPARHRPTSARIESVSPTVSRAAKLGPTLALPGRDYVLLQAALAEFSDPSWAERAGIGWAYGFGPTPNVLWPDDHSWLLATEIDFDSTIIGGRRELIDDVLSAPGIEAAEVGPNDSLAHDADAINGPPAA